MYQWNPVDYASHSSAQLTWANELIAKLNLRGDESVLDVGCGDGKITAAVAASLPRSLAVGIDSSAEMIAYARRAYPEEKHANLSFVQMDARRIQLEPRFDVAFSNAALHWVDDHGAVLRGVKRVLRPNGKLLLSFGGRGNAAEVIGVLDRVRARTRWEPFFRDFRFPYFFLGVEEYRGWLAATGLRTARLELVPKDVVHPGRNAFAGWIRTTWLPYTQRIPENEREDFISEIVDSYLHEHPLDAEGAAHVQMVRLEVEAEAT